MITISLCSHKGGVGKSTSAACFAELLGKDGKKVLLVDTDSQGNLSGRFGFPPSKKGVPVLGDAVRNILSDDPRPLEEFVRKTAYENVDIIPNNDSYAVAERDLLKGVMAGVNSYLFLVRELGPRYDCILLDTPPALNDSLLQVLLASDFVLVPLEASDDAISGAGNMIRFVRKSRKANPKIKVAGAFFNAVNQRTAVAKSYVPKVREALGNLMFDTVIPYSQDAVKAEGMHEPVTSAFPSGKVSEAFRSLLKEVEDRVFKKESV